MFSFPVRECLELLRLSGQRNRREQPYSVPAGLSIPESVDLSGMKTKSRLCRSCQPQPAARSLREIHPNQLVPTCDLERTPAASDPVFCGLAGRRLQGNVLADVIRRSARRARLSKHVTAHTLRHTAATWLRQATGDTRLVAEYLGHADLSTVSRYAHVASRELQSAVQTLADQAAMHPTSAADRAPQAASTEHASARDGRPVPRSALAETVADARRIC
jgi:Phage integrase family